MAAPNGGGAHGRLAAAQALAGYGLPAFPVIPGDKLPAVKGWQAAATTDMVKLAQWFGQGARQAYNIGLAMGPAAGCFALDVDQGGLDTIARLEPDLGDLPPTWTQISQSGGEHRLFAWPAGEPIRNRGRFAPGLDIRGQGGLIVAAGSEFVDQGTGEVRYWRWKAGYAPWEIALAQMPEPWLAVIRAHARKTPPHPPTPSTPPPAGSALARRLQAYAQAIFDRFLTDLAKAGHGYQEAALRNASLKAGSLDARGWLSGSYMRDALIAGLFDAPLHVPHDPWTMSVVVDKVERHMAFGRLNPEPDPDWLAAAAAEAQAQVAAQAWPRQPPREPPPLKLAAVDGEHVEAPEASAEVVQMPAKPKKKANGVGGAPMSDGDKALVRKVKQQGHVLTEYQVAQEFKALYAGKLLFNHSRGEWLAWDASIWRLQETQAAYHYATELANRLALAHDVKTILAAGRAGFPSGVERIARADPVFARKATDFDLDPWLCGCPDGMLNLRSGLVERAEPSLLITRSLAVAPADRPDCPLWLKFLAETFAGPDAAGLIRFVQQWLGYSLTGVTIEHALVFGHGPGGNGKGVLLNTARGIMGDYAVEAAMETFTAGRGQRHMADLAMLSGARMVTTSETEEGQAWAEARLKKLTGGDPMTANFMRENYFTFNPAFKLFVIGNHAPMLQTVDEAMRRRFNVLPFLNRPQTPDLHLEEKLRAEWPGILRWMLDGCLDWQDHRLVRPAAVLVATESYFEKQDVFGQWLAEVADVDPGNDHKSEPRAVLWQSWSEFCKANGCQPGSGNSFAEALERHKIERRHTKTGTTYRGVTLIKRPGPVWGSPSY